MTLDSRLTVRRGRNTVQNTRYYMCRLETYKETKPPYPPPDPEHVIKSSGDDTFINSLSGTTSDRPSDPTIWLYGDVQGNVDQDDSDIYPFTNRVYYTVFNPWIGYPYARWNTNCGCSSGCCFSDNYCGEKVSDWEDFGTPTFSVGEQHWFTNKGWDGMTYYHRMVRNDDSDCKEFVLYIDDAPPTKEGEPRHADRKSTRLNSSH